MERKDCKYFYTKVERYLGIDDRPKVQENPYCRKNKMAIGGCREDCDDFNLIKVDND